MKKLLFFFAVLMATTLGAVAQNRTVSGVVLDATNDDVVIGASVKPVGATGGVVTDADGKFSIRIAASVKELEVSCVGYVTKKAPVEDKMTIILAPSSTALEQLVVTGYGSGKKLGSVVGSVAVVGDKALENITTPSFVDALQGQVAGLSIFSSSGDPSSTENDIRIRGLNSLNSSNTPLFILDGAPVTQTVFSTLNPNDIENITVLKDASSVALYGSRAANGVIVITSKKSKYGERAKVNIRAKYGWSQLPSSGLDMMNAGQYIAYRDKIGMPVSDQARAAYEVYGIDTDWKKEIFNSHAPTYSIEGSINGGSESTRYYVSLNHLDQEGIIDQSGMRRETIRFSIDTKANNWFFFGLQTNLGYTKYETNAESNNQYGEGSNSVYGTNPMVFALTTLPYDSPNYYTFGEDGKLIWGEKAMYLHYTQMPTPEYVNSCRSTWRTRATINTAMYEMIRPIKGLTIRAQQALDAYDSRNKHKYFPTGTLYTPMGDIYTGSAAEGEIAPGNASQAFSRYYQFTYTNTAEYKREFGLHNASVLIGEESIISKSSGFGVATSGHMDIRRMLLTQGTAVSIDNVSDSESELVMNSIFANANYDYDNRYFVDVNYRRDGSSRFAPGHRWSNFYSVGGMWNLKNESFAENLTWLDNAKVRVSYGTTGNSSFANYGYQALVGTGSLYNGGGSIGISQAGNPELSWETVHSFDAGFNAGFLNIFNVDFDFYVKNTHDMLMEIPYSFTTGHDSGWGNVGSMRNTGVDVDVRAAVIKTKDWTWNLRANFNYNKNEITELYDGLDEIDWGLTQLKVGRPAYEYKMVRYAGVDPRDGKQLWLTKEGNLTKTINRDRDAVVLDGKTPLSPWTGGFGTDLRWKGLSLRVDFTWAANKWMRNSDRFFVTDNNSAGNNQVVDMLNVWTKPGDITNIPRVGESIDQFDTRWLEDASYVRLKNLTLMYSLPSNWMKAAGLQAVNVHFTGRNLLTFTDYTGYDPEPEGTSVFYLYPNTRQYEFGIDVTF